MFISSKNKISNKFSFFSKYCFKKFISTRIKSKPATCYYKTLNVSPSASLEEIKREYYMLAKKYHPDNNENSSLNQTEKFKQISEAYEILSDEIQRKEYDRLIFGITDSTKFSNHDVYEFYRNKNKKQNQSNEKQNFDDNKIQRHKTKISPRAQEIQEKLKKGVPIDEILDNYETFREKYKEKGNNNTKGWKEHLYKHDINYNSTDPYHLNKSYGDRYNEHNREEVISDIPYWDTKENDAYWSLSKWQRIKLFVKEKVNMPNYKDFYKFNILVLLILIYYANKKSKQIIL